MFKQLTNMLWSACTHLSNANTFGLITAAFFLIYSKYCQIAVERIF